MSGDIEKTVIKVGSRNSELALIQTNFVVGELKNIHKELDFKIISMSTTGDKILNVALSKIGQTNLFTKELEHALYDGSVDMVVHSLKDLPTSLPQGMTIAALLARNDPHDAVVMHPKYQGNLLANLPEKSVIGTSSLRRIAQLKRKYPHLLFKDIRGNLNTRLRKLEENNEYSALILAKAGLERMGWKQKISQVLEASECMYAVGQGALAVEVREGDSRMVELVSCLHHRETLLRCVAERAFLKQLEGGCSAPVAVNSDLSGDKLALVGNVLSLDGSLFVQDTLSVSLKNPQLTEEESTSEISGDSSRERVGITANSFSQFELQVSENLGVELAKILQEKGALEILRDAKAEVLNSKEK